MRILILLVAFFVGTDDLAAAPQGRGLLWRAVQSCLLNHAVTGSVFPCEAIDTSRGTEQGYAVLRAPLDEAHVIVTPTVRTIGIEAPRLRGPQAPNYFHDAWLARRYATDNLIRAPKRVDYAMAVNSRPGRSQDQLHIHVACVRADVKETLGTEMASIRVEGWKQLRPFAHAPLYHVHFLPEDDLAQVNVIDMVGHELDVDIADMSDVTIAIVGAKPSGFFVLARQKIQNSQDEPHAEALLDPACSAFTKK